MNDENTPYSMIWLEFLVISMRSGGWRCNDEWMMESVACCSVKEGGCWSRIDDLKTMHIYKTKILAWTKKEQTSAFCFGVEMESCRVGCFLAVRVWWCDSFTVLLCLPLDFVAELIQWIGGVYWNNQNRPDALLIKCQERKQGIFCRHLL